MPDSALDYGDPRGDDALRAELAAYLVRVRGVVASADDLVVTGGYTQGLWLTCRALKARGATRVAVEDPSLDDSWATIRSAGLEVVGVPVDEHGIVPDDLDAVAVRLAVVERRVGDRRQHVPQRRRPRATGERGQVGRRRGQIEPRNGRGRIRDILGHFNRGGRRGHVADDRRGAVADLDPAFRGDLRVRLADDSARHPERLGQHS
jgi:hypothetical protein